MVPDHATALTPVPLPRRGVSTTTRRFGRYDQIHNASLHAGFILNLHKVYQAGHYFTCLSRNKLTEPESLKKIRE